MTILLIIIVLGILACWSHPAKLSESASDGINELEQIELGGTKQWISIRGTDINNPVLLFLHGGPGSANLAKLRVQCPELEKHYVVVTWDQHGAGKSYAAWFTDNPPSIEQLQSDTHELVQLLRQRFNGRKIYLVGFSWGSVLGIQTVHDYPDDFEAYIGVGQEANLMEAEKLSLQYVQQSANLAGDQKAIQELRSIDAAYQNANWYDQLMRERKWLLKYGGVYHKTDNFNHEAMMLLQAPEYSFIDFAFWPWSSAKSLKLVWPEVMRVDLFKEVPVVNVPVYFLEGRYDQNTPTSVAVSYFEFLNAPQGKQLIWFDDAAHDVFYDAPQELTQTLISLLDE